MDVLIISDHITPLHGIASVRWTKLGKYLNKAGCNVDILTDEKSYSSEKLNARLCSYDEALAKEIEHFRHYFVIENPFPLGLVYELKNQRYFDLQSRKSQGVVDVSGNDVSWNTKTMFTKSIIIDLCAAFGYSRLANQYDIIVSSFCPYWPHFVARRMKRQNPNAIWVCDYRDLPNATVFGGGWLNNNYLKLVSGEADVILSVSQQIVDSIEGDGLPLRRALENGYDPEELGARNRAKAETFDLVYTGTIYTDDGGSQDLSPLFEILTELVIERAMDPEDLRIRYAGVSGCVFEQQIKPYKFLRFENMGCLSRSAAISLQDSASILIFCTWSTPILQGVTGKIYEYLSSGVPIAGIGTGSVKSSSAKQMVEQSGAGVFLDVLNGPVDHVRLKTFLKSKYDEWRRERITHCDTDWNYVQSFGYDRLALKFLDYMADIAEDRKGEARGR